MPDITGNGIKIHYEDQGSGEPLLFIMGLGGSHLGWVPVLPYFMDKYRCITFDNRGVGLSECPPGPYSIEQMADDTAALIDAIGLGPITCIGASLGSSVLQALLYRHPDKVKKAVLVCPLAWYTDIQHAWLSAGIMLRRMTSDPVILSVSAMPWAFTPRLLGDHFKAAEYARMAVQNPLPTSFEGFEAQGEAIRKYDSREHLPRVKAPTLVVVGAEDILTPVHQAAEIAELIPGAKLVVIPRGGHGGLFEYPDEFVRPILEFV